MQICCRARFSNICSPSERQKHRCTVGEELADAVCSVASAMNRNEYVPRARLREDLDLIFETKYSDIQPYLFKVCLFRGFSVSHSNQTGFKLTWCRLNFRWPIRLILNPHLHRFRQLSEEFSATRLPSEWSEQKMQRQQSQALKNNNLSYLRLLLHLHRLDSTHPGCNL